jgi:hypothetical protein
MIDLWDLNPKVISFRGSPMPSHNDPLGLQRVVRRLSVEEPGRDQGRIESDGLALDVRVEPPLIIGLDQFRTVYSIDENVPSRAIRIGSWLSSRCGMVQESRGRRSQVLLNGNTQALNAADDERRSHDGSLAIISSIWMEGVVGGWVSSFGGEALPETGWSTSFLIYFYGMDGWMSWLISPILVDQYHHSSIDKIDKIDGREDRSDQSLDLRADAPRSRQFRATLGSSCIMLCPEKVTAIVPAVYR